MQDGLLQPFHGVIAPGLFFDGGYTIWFARFSTTPLEVGPYAQVWLIDPRGKRTLYVDPQSAGPTVALFHDLDDGSGAAADWHLPSPDVLCLDLKASDETRLNLTLKFGTTRGCWLLNALLRAPGALHADGRPGAAVERGLQGVFGAQGLRLVGQTEMGRAYRLLPQRVAAVREASAELNGVDLGALSRPTRPIHFGDLQLAERPGLVFGTMYLQYTVWNGNLRQAI
jgi:hypothetical protein